MMTQVQVIPPVKSIPKISDNQPHHVCAYCRVSTDKLDQRNSLEAQKEFFASVLAKHPNWIHVDIFSDEGLSGTSLEKRDNFNEMIHIARQGKVDIILTKEVSRFSRNVQDLLNIVVDLRARGIYVWFLSDDIYTEDNDYRERLTQVAANAEQESLRTSRRVKWGHQQKMQQGIVFGRREMFGYQIVRDRSGKQEFVIIPEEAEIVKQIYKWFAAGDGTHTISNKLKKSGLKTKKYRTGWSHTVILRLLRNEKYVGDLAQGKTYTPDPLTHKKKYNRGEYYSYYIENHHAPIIGRELWNQVQEILKAKEPSDKIKAKHANRYWCSGKVFCGLCGSRYISLSKKQKVLPYKAWDCIENNRHGRYKELTSDTGERVRTGCNGRRVNDRVLKAAVHDIVELLLLPNKEAYIADMQEEIGRLHNPKDHDKDIEELERQIAILNEELDELADKLSKKILTEERFLRVSEKKEDQLTKCKRSLEKLRIGDPCASLAVRYSNRCLEEMQAIADLSDDKINEEFFERITKKIVVYPSNIIEVYLTAMPCPVRLHYQTQGRGKTFTPRFTVLTRERFEELCKDMTKNVLFPSHDTEKANSVSDYE